MIKDSIGQDVNPGDLCILPWKSNKMTLGYYSHETTTKYIFNSRHTKAGSRILSKDSCKLNIYRSLVNKYNGHFIRIPDSELDKYIV